MRIHIPHKVVGWVTNSDHIPFGADDSGPCEYLCPKDYLWLGGVGMVVLVAALFILSPYHGDTSWEVVLSIFGALVLGWGLYLVRHDRVTAQSPAKQKQLRLRFGFIMLGYGPARVWRDRSPAEASAQEEQPHLDS